MNRFAVTILSVILFSVSLSGQDLVILHTNDTHSQIEPIRVGLGNGKAGVSRRAEYFSSVKKEVKRKNLLIVDAGDYNQGTPYFTVYKGDLEIELMNAFGYEVVCLGNHEFDNGQKELARRLSKAKFQTVCANYDFSQTPLQKYVKPYVIVKKAGKRIGIIGLITNLDRVVSGKNIEGMVYTNPIETANKLAAELKSAKKCDMVIVLSHLGYDSKYPETPSDVSLAAKSEDIDLIIGGHSHTFLKKETVVKNLKGVDVPVVQDGAQGEYVGRLDITF